MGPRDYLEQEPVESKGEPAVEDEGVRVEEETSGVVVLGRIHVQKEDDEEEAPAPFGDFELAQDPVLVDLCR